MSIHLFSTPVECTNCGTVVEDPTVDRCPSCSAVLRERRTPSRLAGVERRYGGLRFLLGVLRFLAVVTLAVGFLLAAFGELPVEQRLLLALGGAVLAVVILAAAALFDVILAIEENTRAAFRIQQRLLTRVEAEDDRAPRTQPVQ